MATYLDKIAAYHRARAEADNRPLDSLRESALSSPEQASLLRALAGSATVGIIAEVKRRSPSKGALNESLDVASLVGTYASSGACAVSVLTDAEHFGGSPDDFAMARLSTALPLLRKDFTVSAKDVADARTWGASAVLLIVAILDDGELEMLANEAALLGVDALFEVHDEFELERAISSGAALVGVNQRDLYTFEVDTERAARVGSTIPRGIVSVAESGIRGLPQVEVLARSGFDALLVGESFVRSTDPGATVREFASVPKFSR